MFEAVVVDLASDGRGIVKHADGRAVFVPGVWIGEVGKFKITGKKGRLIFGELLELTKPSPERVSAPCQHHGVYEGACGGCPWQFIRYEAQLAVKQERVEQAFRRVGVESVVKSIAGSEKTLAYRNRAQLKSDGRKLGFVAAKSQRLVDVEQCLVLSERNQATLEALRQCLPNQEWKPNRKQNWVTLDIDEEVGAANVSINQRLPFRQANDGQNLFMQNWLARHLGQLDAGYSVLELFCGSGNFTQVIAEQGFNKVYAVEAVEDALRQLDELQLQNTTTIKQDLFAGDAFANIYQKVKSPQVLVLDPPRDGLKNKDGFIRKKHPFKHIFYVSCDLMTLVRDVQFLQDNKYRVREVQPVDQFPHTPHIELLVKLDR